jgi:hypothetical protein
MLNLSQTEDDHINATWHNEDESPRDYCFLLPAGKQGQLRMQDQSDFLGILTCHLLESKKSVLSFGW